MTSKQVIQSVLEMPSIDRAEIASALIDSLDAAPEDDATLMDEALRRDQAVEEGKARYLDEAEFRRAIGRQ
jgi:hypothetical protein